MGGAEGGNSLFSSAFFSFTLLCPELHAFFA
ncbi:putative membrane protein, partial [Bacteroides fragilis str. 3397 T10]